MEAFARIEKNIAKRKQEDGTRCASKIEKEHRKEELMQKQRGRYLLFDAYSRCFSRCVRE